MSKVVKDCWVGQIFNHEGLCNASEPPSIRCSITKLEQSAQISFSSSQSPFLLRRRFYATSPIGIYPGPHARASARMRIRSRSNCVKKPKTGSSPLHNNTITSCPATAEAENRGLQLEDLRLQFEVNNLANKSQTATAERDTG
jgi:hypothetical protein